MSSTYTASPAALASGQAVQFVEPNDGDLASAASVNVGTEAIADMMKALVNHSILGGIAPSIKDTNLPNGLLFASETVNSVKTRIYSRTGTAQFREFLVTSNASWNGTVWTYDSAAEDSYCMGLHGPDANAGVVTVGHHDNTLAATWNNSAWETSLKSYQGAATGTIGKLIATQTPIAVTGGIGYQNSWVDYTAGGVEGVHYYKDVHGRVWFQGGLHGGGNGTIAFTMLAAYWPQHTRAFRANLGAGTDNVVVSVTTTGDVTVTYTGAAPAGITLDGCSYN